MGKKPFSAKAKREQLRKKRLAATGSSVSPPGRNVGKQPLPLASSASSPHTQHSVSVSTVAPPRHPRGRAPRGAHAQRFRLQLGDAEASTSKQSELAHASLAPVSIVDTSVDEVRPYPDDCFAMPRRPAWRYDDDISAVDRRETVALRAWRDRVVAGHDSPPFFEHNLETWRQLWRVIERSNVIVVVAEIRYPALHFVPDLYYYVADDLGKGVVLALNKCDLVSYDVLTAWKNYFAERYPRMPVALFSSFPDAKLAPSEHNSNVLSKRERRMARSKLSAWGADQLLNALYSLDLDSHKKGYLEEWRAQLEGGSSDEEDGSAKSFGAAVDPYNYGEEEDYLENESLATRLREKQSNTHRKRRRSNLRPDDANEHGLANTLHSSEEETAGKEGSRSIMEKFVPGDEKDDCDARNMITIGFVGHPNAGKSSLINGIFRKKVVSTSKTPGHTKHLQTIFLTDNVRLCDCPGLVFPGLAPRELQIIAGMYPIAQVREPLSVVKYLAERVRLVELLKLDMEVTKLQDFLLENDYLQNGWTAWKICEAWAMKRGYRTAKAARLDVPRAANHILRLALEGRIVLSTVPRGFKPTTDGAHGHSVMDNDWSEVSVGAESGYGDSEVDIEHSIQSVEHGASLSSAPGLRYGSYEEDESSKEDRDSDDDENDDEENGDEENAKSPNVAVGNTFALLDEEVE